MLSFDKKEVTATFTEEEINLLEVALKERIETLEGMQAAFNNQKYITTKELQGKISAFHFIMSKNDSIMEESE